eukprot:CAMPEP_0185020404 /NCGR_PEP_ID=MMETSP1103-20130426/3009_1 /TAXON_ID=36769 /ORGANISM="Paraphysomonas bandaiensis, Strain Caron Lab Isolate" /LENGTH=47 /DNA_ID= /DNA_START= /DNA_END= /DNA_ORIENTATION=
MSRERHLSSSIREDTETLPVWTESSVRVRGGQLLSPPPRLTTESCYE